MGSWVTVKDGSQRILLHQPSQEIDNIGIAGFTQAQASWFSYLQPQPATALNQRPKNQNALSGGFLRILLCSSTVSATTYSLRNIYPTKPTKERGNKETENKALQLWDGSRVETKR